LRFGRVRTCVRPVDAVETLGRFQHAAIEILIARPRGLALGSLFANRQRLIDG
jgi:hypothetical protein